MELLRRIIDRPERDAPAPAEPVADGGCCAFELAEDDAPERAEA